MHTLCAHFIFYYRQIVDIVKTGMGCFSMSACGSPVFSMNSDILSRQIIVNGRAKRLDISVKFVNPYKLSIYSVLPKIEEHIGMTFSYTGIIFKKMTIFLLHFCIEK